MAKENFERGRMDSPENQDNLGQNWKNKKDRFIPIDQVSDLNIEKGARQNMDDLSPAELMMRGEEGTLERETSAKKDFAILVDHDDYTPNREELEREKSDWEKMDLDKNASDDLLAAMKIKETNPIKDQRFRTKETHVPKPPKFKGAPTIRNTEEGEEWDKGA